MTYVETVYAENLDKAKPETIEVRDCSVVNLPFRLRIGNSYTFPKSDDGDFKLYFRNQYEIPPGGTKIKDLQDQASKQGKKNFFYTKVLIMLKEPQPTYYSLKVLNDFIVAYGTVTTSPMSLFGENVRALAEWEFSEAREWKITYNCSKGHVLTDSEVDNLINKTPGITCNFICFPDVKIKELHPEALEKIPSTFELHKKFIFYEFAYEAKVRMFSEDYITAVLMACIALEGAHGAFLNYVRISENEKKCERNLNNKSKKDRSVSGFYISLENTISEYMDSQEKPPDDLMTRCKPAIKIRDDIMHAISTKGVYEFRKYQRADFVKAYQTFLQTYEYFRKALENRVG